MSNSTRDQFNDLLRSEGLNAGIIPVSNIPNEESRLNEVNRLGILNRDLDQEAQYNALTQLAAIITKSQIGLINILGSNIQQCKTNFGFNVVESTLTEEMPRENSICQYSLASPQEPLIINDLFLDERTKHFKKLEAYENLRFYAGSPLISSRGFSIGTLCVIDDKPKKLNMIKLKDLGYLQTKLSIC